MVRLAVCVLLSLTQVNALTEIDKPITCGFNTARFCESGSYVQGGKEQTVQKRLSDGNAGHYGCTGSACPGFALYDAKYNVVNEYRYEQEYFEGSIALTQVGVAWKQISTQSGDRFTTYASSGGTVQVTEVIRIKHFWQLPHHWSAPHKKLDYDDLRTNSLDPAINDFYEVLYTNPMSGTTYSDTANHDVYQWFAGDLVPMKSCAYIVNMNHKSPAIKHYSFQRIMMSIQYDPTTYKKIVKVVPDADRKFSLDNSAGGAQSTAYQTDDIPLTALEINFYWRWAAFYWFQKGKLFIKQDSIFPKTTEADACQRDTPIFNPTKTDPLNHIVKDFTTDGIAASETIVSHAFVYEGLYMVWSGNKQRIIRLEGIPGDWVLETSFFTMSMVSSHTAIAGFGTKNILQIASMEYYGLMVNVGEKTFIEIEPDKIMERDATTGLLVYLDKPAAKHKYLATTLKYAESAQTDPVQTVGIRVRTDANALCNDAASTGFKFLQTYGEMHMHRPVWMICQGASNASQTTIWRITTVINKFMQIPTGHPMIAFTKLYDFKQQTLRFHMLATQPGNTNTQSPNSATAPDTTNKALTGNIQTWQSTEAVVVDLRQEDEVLRWPLSTCGDTVVNATSFEDCDYAKGVDTPINLNNAGLQAMNTYVYPAPDLDTYTCTDGRDANTQPKTQYCPAAAMPVPPIPVWEAKYMKNQRTDLNIVNTAGQPAQKTERWSGHLTIWFDPVTKKYYNCDLLCKKVELNLCGDGIPSNGRVPGADYPATPAGANYWVKAPTNQQVGVDLTSADAGYELCDDGNNRDGDGCSKDCKTIETGWECPRWGAACNLQCGNGRRQWNFDTTTSQNVSTSYARVSRVVGTVGNVITEPEECDLGYISAENTDPSNAKYKTIACNADCKITDKNLWKCEWIADYQTEGDPTTPLLGYHSKCHYLCGNKVVDTTTSNTAMTVSETCDKGVQQWKGMEYSNGYKYALKTSPKSSQEFTGAWSNPPAGKQIFGSKTNSESWHGDFPVAIGTSLPYIDWKPTPGQAGYTTVCPTGATWLPNTQLTNWAVEQKCWFNNPQQNIGWLVGCSEFCQVISTTAPAGGISDPTNPAAASGGTVGAVPSSPADGALPTGSGPGGALTYTDGGTTFKCPTTFTTPTACTDRCGDGIYDGLIEWGDFGRNRSTKPYPTGINGYTKRNILFGFDYAMRMPNEECDTGQDLGTGTDQVGYNPDGIGMNPSTHGCDRMCKIVPGWECSIFFYKMLRREAWNYQGNSVPENMQGISAMGLGIEEPLFRSECWQTDAPNMSQTDQTTANGPWRRRLMPEDFDPHGRWLHHLPKRYNYFKMPTNTNEFYNDALKLSPQTGLNGQLRLVEAPATRCTAPETDACCGVIFGFEATKKVDSDYVYLTSRGKPTPTNDYADAAGKILMSANTNALRGKMRNTFGMYLVMNKSLNEIEIYGYDSSLGVDTTKLKLLWTSAVETSVQYMGAHEFYWWPYKQFLMAKLSDGSSFKFIRMAKDFQTKAATADSAHKFEDKIQANGYNLFHANGRVTVPPVFHEKFIYLYTTNKDFKGFLRAYQYNPGRMELDLVCQKDFGVEVSSLYENYSLVNVGADGVIFIAYSKFASTAPYDKSLFKCDGNSNVETWPTTFTETAVTINYSACVAATKTGPAPIYCGTAQDGSLNPNIILRQPREDPETYVSGTIPDIWGWLNNQYFMKFTYASGVLTVAKSISLPYQLNLTGVNYTTKTQGTLQAANIDVGKQFLAILSPMQCNVQYSATAKNPINNPSVYYYFLAAQPHQDLFNCLGAATPDGFDDFSATNCQPDMNNAVTPPVQKTDAVSGALLWINPVVYNVYKGWTCVNLPNDLFEPGSEAWQDQEAAWKAMDTDPAKKIWSE